MNQVEATKSKLVTTSFNLPEGLLTSSDDDVRTDAESTAAAVRLTLSDDFIIRGKTPGNIFYGQNDGMAGMTLPHLTCLPLVSGTDSLDSKKYIYIFPELRAFGAGMLVFFDYGGLD